MLDLVNILLIGFSIISAIVLFVAYAFFLQIPGKTWFSIVCCGLLLLALSSLQLGHLQNLIRGIEPLDSAYYQCWLFASPMLFFFFSRSVIMPTAPLKPYLLVHLLPLALLFAKQQEIALPVLFLIGASYSVWFAAVIYGLREQRKRFQFELFFFGMFALVALLVLVLGFSLPFMGHEIFYYFYSHSIALAFVLIVGALIAFPDLLLDLSEAGRIKYSVSTLKNVEVDRSVEQLNTLMTTAKSYQNENLNLSSLASEIGLSSAQLSELINTQFRMGFSRYIRQQRIEAAKAMLISEPQQSILSISMETGFRSQSNFYTAFKDLTGQSPGEYRKSHRA